MLYYYIMLAQLEHMRTCYAESDLMTRSGDSVIYQLSCVHRNLMDFDK